MLLRAARFTLRNKAVGVADRGAAFALADVSTKSKGLAEGQPMLRTEATPDDRIPKNENVNSRIAPLADLLQYRQLVYVNQEQNFLSHHKLYLKVLLLVKDSQVY